MKRIGSAALATASPDSDGLDRSWWPDWSGQTVVIVASGPSAGLVDLTPCRDRARTIAVNRSYELAPWADMLYACDLAWWLSVDGLPDWPTLKVSQDPKAVAQYPDIKRVASLRGVENLILDQPGYILWGGNSGTQAINVAAQTGCRAIVLVGFDMTLDHGLHWHGAHEGKLSNPKPLNTELWKRRTDQCGDFLAAKGFKIANCSPLSALKKWPKMSLEDALDL
jgi:hypothetical protein